MCVWQSITNIVDGYFYLLAAAAAMALFAIIIIGLAARFEIDTDRRADRRIRTGTDNDDDEPSDLSLSTTSYAWFVPVRRVLWFVILMMFAYPLSSPTFCLNLKCSKRFPQLFQLDRSCGAGNRSSLNMPSLVVRTNRGLIGLNCTPRPLKGARG